jgi:hypothetical protein
MAVPESVRTLDRELRGIFGARLHSVLAYGSHGAADGHHGHGRSAPARAMAVVESLTDQDLRACAARTPSWHAIGLATPLIVVSGEFTRSLDAFPLEFDAIAADHVVVSGASPFEGARVEAADIRRACEVHARSHLLHLREGAIEAAGNAHALAVLLVESAAPLNALLMAVGRLEGRNDRDPAAAARHAERAIGLTGGLADIAALHEVKEIASAEADRLFAPYLAAVEKLVEYVDGWAARR